MATVIDATPEATARMAGPGLKAPNCQECLRNAGVASGMAGAAPCAILSAAAEEDASPSEWRLQADFDWSCSAFEPAW